MQDQKTPLSAIDWIQAAFRALAKGGPQAIRAEAIARDLKVSKGSFYWHFKDVPALKKAMLDHWQRKATEAIIQLVDNSGENSAGRLYLLVEVATNTDTSAYGGVNVEAAIRDWGRYDEHAYEAVKTVDEKRLHYVTELFSSCSVPEPQCKRFSRLLYSSLIGLEALSGNTKADRKDDLLQLLDVLLGGNKAAS
ncbi:TetR/AcrR family transcriptional regulator [Roseibium sp. SCPC15]|uniref:TetR/AcrR family transcriptional regulator n=1 Tax=Roseibium sp. SCP15 TaxID=3141376 RepID=UPI003338ABF5